MNNSDLYILTFIATGLWDVVLRVMTENWDKLPKVVKKILPFIEYLKPYFKRHTLLAAALIAAFVGATTQLIIVNIMVLLLFDRLPLTHINSHLLVEALTGK